MQCYLTTSNISFLHPHLPASRVGSRAKSLGAPSMSLLNCRGWYHFACFARWLTCCGVMPKLWASAHASLRDQRPPESASRGGAVQLHVEEL